MRRNFFVAQLATEGRRCGLARVAGAGSLITTAAFSSNFDVEPSDTAFLDVRTTDATARRRPLLHAAPGMASFHRAMKTSPIEA